jgi:DNA-binding response OmpR family regulator
MNRIKFPRQKQILIVEDHPESAELLLMILENEGYEARCVETGHAALQVFTSLSADETSTFHPDLFLIDLWLPDMNGVEIVGELKKSQAAIPPVIFLSADTPQTLKTVASSVGATAIRKPFDIDELLEMIATALAKAV